MVTIYLSNLLTESGKTKFISFKQISFFSISTSYFGLEAFLGRPQKWLKTYLPETSGKR